tara:strand:+ start:15310 stop:15885 length:576 start_codon:yes stop_codon:yes gene_type:complete
MKKTLCLFFIPLCAAQAETENFDMTLSGYFDKDYCALNLGNPTPTISFDFSSKEPEPFFSPGYEGPTQSVYTFRNIETGTYQSVTCSPGTYSFTLLTSNQGALEFEGYGGGYLDARIYFDGEFWDQKLVKELNPAPGSMLGLPTVEIDSTREVVRFEYIFNFSFPSENLPSLPESITTNPSWLNIIINKVD